MSILNSYKLLDPRTIFVDRENRQRREIKTDDLDDSIAKRGVLSPLLVERHDDRIQLIFGERRLTSAIKVGLKQVPVRFAEDLSAIERQIIELEENVKRKDLPWRDEVRSVGKIHELYVAQADTEEWSQADTAKAIGLSPQHLSHILRVYRDLDSPLIAGAVGIAAAYNALARRDERKMGDALSELLEATGGVLETVAPPEPQMPAHPEILPPPAAAEQPDLPLASRPKVVASVSAPATPAPRAPTEIPIYNQDFLEWAPAYSGPKFNFLHCDFPYGINVFDGKAGSGSEFGFEGGAEAMAQIKAQLYDDRPEVYWELCKCLCENLDRLMSHSAHLMFWLSLDKDTLSATYRFFEQNAPDLVFGRTPLIWHKTDNRGILSDPKRGPRHIYEGALIASREDRLIIKATADVYGCPSDKTHHQSTKPEPMLRYFFGMFVDEGTRMLDPTCGGGSSLRAAESLGATVLGLEKDAEHCAVARAAMRSFRVMRKLT